MFLDPGKLLVIAAVALVVVGPERLPKVARTIGSLWHDFSRWRATIDEQVRGVFPDLPATHEIAAAVRSPVALLDRLAREAVAQSHAEEPPAEIKVSALGDDVGPDSFSMN
jgi:Sec-independent protein translocase protein TatA